MDWMFSCGLLWCSNGIFLHEKKPKYSTSLLARQQILSRVNKLKVWTSSFVDSGLSSLCYQGPGSSLTALQVDVKHLNWFCMDWCPPLQPQQFPLFWEGLLQDFGMCLLEFFAHSSRRAWGQGFLWFSQVLSHQTHTTHAFMDHALCTGAQSCWNRKGLPQTVPAKLETCNCPKCLSELKDFDFPSFPSRISLHSAARQVIFLLTQTCPSYFANREVCLITQ